LHYRRLVISANDATVEHTVTPTNTTAVWHTIATVTAQLHTTVVTTYTDKPLTTLSNEQLAYVKPNKAALVWRVRAYNSIGHSQYTVASQPIHLHDHIMIPTLRARSYMHDTADTAIDDTLYNGDNSSGIDNDHDTIDNIDADTTNDGSIELDNDVLGISSCGQLTLDAIFTAKHKAYRTKLQCDTATTTTNNTTSIAKAIDTLHNTVPDSVDSNTKHLGSVSSTAVASTDSNAATTTGTDANAESVADMSLSKEPYVSIDETYTVDMHELEYMMNGTSSSTVKAYSKQGNTAATYNDNNSLTMDNDSNATVCRNDSLSECNYVSNLMMFQDEFLQFDSSIRIDNKQHRFTSHDSKEFTGKNY
jgi:hypothetical protein